MLSNSDEVVGESRLSWVVVGWGETGGNFFCINWFPMKANCRPEVTKWRADGGGGGRKRARVSPTIFKKSELINIFVFSIRSRNGCEFDRRKNTKTITARKKMEEEVWFAVWIFFFQRGFFSRAKKNCTITKANNHEEGNGIETHSSKLEVTSRKANADILVQNPKTARVMIIYSPQCINSCWKFPRLYSLYGEPCKFRESIPSSPPLSSSSYRLLFCTKEGWAEENDEALKNTSSGSQCF